MRETDIVERLQPTFVRRPARPLRLRLPFVWRGKASILCAIMLPAMPLAGLVADLGWSATLLIWAQLVLMLGSGRVACRALGLREDPFLALVVGFVLLTHAMLLGAMISPGLQQVVAVAFVIPAAAGLRQTSWPNGRNMLGLAVFVGLFALAWNVDVAPRLAAFHATGQLNFWSDLYFHAGSLGQFGAPEMVGRGVSLLADIPRPFYHYASMMPVALLPQVVGTPLLDAIVLVWIQLGVPVMACGIAALCIALAGPGLAVATLIAFALLPNPEWLGTGNGFLGFAWIVETNPGTPYSLGVACAALAVLVRWMRDQRRVTLAGALGLVALCLLIRANTFVWLAPTVALGVIAGWRTLRPHVRALLIAVAFLAITAVLVALSWSALLASPGETVFGYMEWLHSFQQPTYIDGLYHRLTEMFGRGGAGLLGVPLALFGLLGPWLPIGLVVGVLAWRRGRLTPADALPGLMLGVACLAMLLAPMARNGDITEYRQRPGPLLVVMVVVWTLHLAAQLCHPLLLRVGATNRRSMLVGAQIVSLLVLSLTIGTAKLPRMAWASDFYGKQLAPEWTQLASRLASGGQDKPVFIVAGQPSDSRTDDDAAHLVALSGVPAFLSCTALQVILGDPWRSEADRRLAVSMSLADAPDLKALQSMMRREHITHYVVTSANDARFDPTRHDATGVFGPLAIYDAK